MSQNIRVRDCMSRDSYQIAVAASVDEAARALQHHRLPGAPVVDEQKRLVGFVSEHDLLQQVLQSSYYCDGGVTVRDVMRTEVLSVSPNDDIVELINLMARPDKPKVFPVLEGHKVIGIITRGLLLQALLENRTRC